MKAVTINISLNPDLADFARADSEAGAFDSMSEYMRELIRQRRQARVAEDVAMLEKAIAGAPTGDPSEDELRQIYAVAKKGRKK
jgi:Arc/MetJ-type ribon-helix-helix transcriptional regulator